MTDATEGKTKQVARSAVIANRTDAFGLVEWFVHHLTDNFQMMIDRDIRVDVTIEFQEQEQVSND